MADVREQMDMRGRRALITGAGGALGRVIADTLAELGADLFLVDRAQTDFKALEVALSRHGKRDIRSLPCDLENEAERKAICAQATAAGVNVLVNNAAFVGTSELQGWGVPFEQQSIDTWRRAMEVNLTAAFDLCQQLTPALRQAGNGSIINVGSIYGLVGPDWSLYEGTAMANPAAYAASKGGLLQLTRWLATTLGPDIRVNCVSPGGIFRNQPEAFVQRYQARTPLGRMATEEDFRGAFAYLASDLSKYVTGQNLTVDGGWSAW